MKRLFEPTFEPLFVRKREKLTRKHERKNAGDALRSKAFRIITKQENKPKKYYSAARRESMRYAEAMYAPLFGRTVKKTLAIREHLYDI